MFSPHAKYLIYSLNSEGLWSNGLHSQIKKGSLVLSQLPPILGEYELGDEIFNNDCHECEKVIDIN